MADTPLYPVKFFAVNEPPVEGALEPHSFYVLRTDDNKAAIYVTDADGGVLPPYTNDVSAVWGNITGVLADQLDLQTTLTGFDTRISDLEAVDLGSTYQAVSEKSQPSGYASLDGSGRVPASELPSISATSPVVLTAHNASETPLTVNMAASQTAMPFILKDSLGAQVLAIDAAGTIFGDGANAKLALQDYAGRVILGYGYNWFWGATNHLELSLQSGDILYFEPSAFFPVTTNSIDLGKSANAFKNIFAQYYRPATSTNAAAPNNSMFYSSDNSKLVYKDAGGTVNNLY
jgi:hypothetical protein